MGLFDFLKRKDKIEPTKASGQVLKSSTNYKANLDKIQKAIYDNLKPQGFIKKGRTLNRETEKGLYQVINFQSGKFPLGDSYEIPGIRDSYYGKFTINMGICVEDLYNLMFPTKPKTFYQEYECQLRTRLADLTKGEDFWWTLDDDTDKTSKEIIDGINTKGLTWFGLFDNREKLCENWGNYGGYIPSRHKLDIALVIFFSDKQKGERLIKEYFDNIPKDNRPHIQYTINLAAGLGITLNQ
jgi:hypothetical protein